MYYFENFEEAYDFLITEGGYPEGTFICKEGENYDTFRAKIFRIASRVKDCLSYYPREILDYLSTHPSAPQYTKEYLGMLTYRELAEIRTELGISKRKSRKKVERVEPAISTTQKGLQSIRSRTAAEVAYSAITSAHDEIDTKDEAILTEEEIAFMYGDDMPSLEELRRSGIVPEFSEEYKRRNEKPIDYQPRKKK